jgi:antagonist of KipI
LTISVLKFGLPASIQDMGRSGMRALGIPVGGAADPANHRAANFLVYNAGAAATLEIAGGGFSASVEKAGWMAFAGAGALFVSGARISTSGRLVYLPEKTVFEIKTTADGIYTYCAVPGGWDVPQALGSASTCSVGGFGGVNGRVLAKGDVLWAREKVLFSENNTPEKIWISPWYADLSQNNPAFLKSAENTVSIRFLRGPEWDWWTPEQRALFCETTYRVSHDRDRMGIRLEGKPLAPDRHEHLLSTGVDIGTIQVPPDGRPIVLSVDAQTVGGYPRIGQVISVDTGRMAQIPGGRSVRFVPVGLDEAERLLFREAGFLKQLELGARFQGVS